MNTKIEYTYNGKRVRLHSGRTVYRLSSIRHDPNAGPHVWARCSDGERVLAKKSKLRPVIDVAAR